MKKKYLAGQSGKLLRESSHEVRTAEVGRGIIDVAGAGVGGKGKPPLEVLE